MITCPAPVPLRRLLLALLFPLCQAASADTFGNFTYTVNGGAVTITDYLNTATGPAVIPASISGRPVTAIANSAFSYCKLETVTIPDSVVSLGSYAFQNCDQLVEVTIPAGIHEVSQMAFDRW